MLGHRCRVGERALKEYYRGRHVITLYLGSPDCFVLRGCRKRESFAVCWISLLLWFGLFYYVEQCFSFLES